MTHAPKIKWWKCTYHHDILSWYPTACGEPRHRAWDLDVERVRETERHLRGTLHTNDGDGDGAGSGDGDGDGDGAWGFIHHLASERYSAYKRSTQKQQKSGGNYGIFFNFDLILTSFWSHFGDLGEYFGDF